MALGLPNSVHCVIVLAFLANEVVFGQTQTGMSVKRAHRESGLLVAIDRRLSEKGEATSGAEAALNIFGIAVPADECFATNPTRIAADVERGKYVS
jgi:hypothetical protein